MNAEGRAATARLFVALDLPPDVLPILREWQRRELGARRELRLPESVHLTLCFLGETPRERVPEVEAALAGIAWAPIATSFSAPLFLPERGARRVIALRLEDPEGALASLQARVAGELARRGLYEPEKRRYLAHVTVARFRRPGHPFSLQNVTIPEFGVVRMVLYSSLLERTGAVHTPVTVFPAS